MELSRLGAPDRSTYEYSISSMSITSVDSAGSRSYMGRRDSIVY